MFACACGCVCVCRVCVRPRQFLESLQIMDYSLLVGIHRKTRAQGRGARRASVHVPSSPAPTASVFTDASVALSIRRDTGGSGADSDRVSVRPPRSDGDGIEGWNADGSPNDEVYFLGE